MRPILLEQQNEVFIVLQMRRVEVKLRFEGMQSWLMIFCGWIYKYSKFNMQ